MSARKFLLLLAVLAVLVAGGYYGTRYLQENAQTVPVLSVTDGDTFRVQMPDGSSAAVRVLGIDTPELPDACYAEQARDEVSALLAGQEVLLQQAHEQPDKDRYQRLLRYVEVSDTFPDLGAYLVEYGYARVYEEYPVSRTPQYLELQQVAQQENRGLWSC